MAEWQQKVKNGCFYDVFLPIFVQFWNDEVLGAVGIAAPDEAFHVGEDAAEGGGVAAGKGRAGTAFHGVEDGGGCQILSLGIVVGDGEALMEEEFFGRLLLELLVGGHQLAGLLSVEPVGNALFEECQGLGVELLVVDALRKLDGACELDADEATAARGVAEHIGHVRSGDERGQARQVLDMLAVGSLHLHRCQLDDVLQESLLHLGRNLVELVEVDEQKLAHGLQDGLLLGEHEVVVVAPLQLRGNE